MFNHDREKSLIACQRFALLTVLLLFASNVRGAEWRAPPGSLVGLMGNSQSASSNLGKADASRVIGDCKLEVCKATVNSPAKSCYGISNDCIDLECVPDNTAPITNTFSWYMNPLSANSRYLGNMFETKDPNYEVAFSYTLNTLRLQIKSLRGVDVGRNMFSAVQLQTNKTCYFNIFSYDPTNYTASVTIDGYAYPLNGTRNITAVIDSFKVTTAYPITYRYAALPLDSLLVNGANATSQSCVSVTYPWLKCLETTSATVPLTRCVATYQLGLGYSYDDPDQKFTVLAPKRNFNATINLLCKL
jgi:hypothetical protein